MGVFSRRRAPAFTAETHVAPNIRSSSIGFAGTAGANALENSHNGKPGFNIGRRLSQALIPTLPRAPLPLATETSYDNEKTDNYAGRAFDDVFKLELEADVLASDEEIEPEEQRIETLDNDYPGWPSAVEEEDTEQERRHGRKHGSGRKKSSRHRNHQSSRSRSRSKRLSRESYAESDLTLEGDSTISMGAVPTSSPFGRLSTEYQDDLSDDEDEPAMHTSIRLLPSAPISPSIAVPVGDGYDALDVMADYLFRFGCEQKKWFQRPPVTAKEKRRTYSSKHVATGVCIRAKTGIQRVYPANLPGLAAFETAVTALNPEVSGIAKFVSL
ncbi:hypothetical protein QFC19_000746 [Naganishia cerealis]|uniref:Uncharacterized protein n=1 Tax=Naganishia cerealis TaxID=610337 RepID=A0ACC2WLL0_9TREE|nr:hypothetical protein QFC19_000746 [Naganishia cerealis]